MSRKLTPEQFFARGRVEGECLVWTGRLSAKGYGVVMWRGHTQQAHRVAYRLAIGEIPDGLELDHLCRTRSCIRPDHLEAVTHLENIARAARILSEECGKGHPLTPENLMVLKTGVRRCRICSRERWKKYYTPHPRTSWPTGRTGSHTSRNVGDQNPNSRAWKAAHGRGVGSAAAE